MQRRAFLSTCLALASGPATRSRAQDATPTPTVNEGLHPEGVVVWGQRWFEKGKMEVGTYVDVFKDDASAKLDFDRFKHYSLQWSLDLIGTVAAVEIEVPVELGAERYAIMVTDETYGPQIAIGTVENNVRHNWAIDEEMDFYGDLLLIAKEHMKFVIGDPPKSIAVLGLIPNVDQMGDGFKQTWQRVFRIEDFANITSDEIKLAGGKRTRSQDENDLALNRH